MGQTWAPPGRGKGGHVTPLKFGINFLFWKGVKFAGSVGHPMTKNAFSFRGLHPLIP